VCAVAGCPNRAAATRASLAKRCMSTPRDGRSRGERQEEGGRQEEGIEPRLLHMYARYLLHPSLRGGTSPLYPSPQHFAKERSDQIPFGNKMAWLCFSGSVSFFEEKEYSWLAPEAIPGGAR
jgi:hypothetical protein